MAQTLLYTYENVGGTEKCHAYLLDNEEDAHVAGAKIAQKAVDEQQPAVAYMILPIEELPV